MEEGLVIGEMAALALVVIVKHEPSTNETVASMACNLQLVSK